MVDEVEPVRRAYDRLSSEVRLRIITALGDASGEDGYATLPFSDLQRAASVDDSGHFTYHLKQLVGEFIEETEGGYCLTLAGIRTYQAVVAGGVDDAVEVDPFEVGATCPTCGGNQHMWYTGSRAIIGCLDCDTVQFREPLPSDTFDHDDPDSLVDTITRQHHRDLQSFHDGVCPYCLGSVDWKLTTTEDVVVADADRILAHVWCHDCSWFSYGGVGDHLYHHPAVSSFLYRHGVAVTELSLWADETDSLERVTQTDPVQIEVVYELGDERLRVVVDESMDLVSRTVESRES
ncbi:DUF7351 domain-containing protein [Halobaculum limi]|uniref:DUF7351 domain-containing protein n=1 Tax=Halobaculum limi TaxID=3031916 RepID=UPI002407091F|nr:hypothetical protein [Halobaculum sp. YSMS11]